jgi:hypothetical protein
MSAHIRKTHMHIISVNKFVSEPPLISRLSFRTAHKFVCNDPKREDINDPSSIKNIHYLFQSIKRRAAIDDTSSKKGIMLCLEE